MSFFPSSSSFTNNPNDKSNIASKSNAKNSDFKPSSSVFYVSSLNNNQDSNINNSNRSRSYSNSLNLNITNNITKQSCSNLSSPTTPIANNQPQSNHHISYNSSGGGGGFGKIKNNLIKNFEKLEKFFNNNKKSNETSLNSYKRNLSNCSLDSKLSHPILTENFNLNSLTPEEKLKLNSLAKIEDNSFEENYANIATVLPNISFPTENMEFRHNFQDYNNNDSNQASVAHQNQGFNPIATAINKVKIIHNKIPSNYYNDKETQIELNKKLSLLSNKDRILLQKKGYDLLLQQVENKKIEYIALQADINELNSYLVKKAEQVRSAFEIELIKSQIRDLTNEKAKLEFKISKKSNWICKKCTCSNVSEAIICKVCSYDRDDGEIINCSHCGTKNSLFNTSCTNCNSYLISVDLVRQSSNNSTSRSKSNSSSSLLGENTNSSNNQSNLNVPSNFNLRSSPSPSSNSINFSSTDSRYAPQATPQANSHFYDQQNIFFINSENNQKNSNFRSNSNN